MKQTAIDFLQDEILKDRMIKAKSIKEWNDVIDKAREMEKQQIIDAFEEGSSDGFYGWGSSNKEQYYNETYGSKGSDISPKVQNKDSFGDTSSKIKIK